MRSTSSSTRDGSDTGVVVQGLQVLSSKEAAWDGDGERKGVGEAGGVGKGGKWFFQP